MANGAAVALPRELDPSPTKPTEVEQRIGQVMADAALAVGAGVLDWEANGALSGATRARAGDLFVAMYRLQEGVGEINFKAIARREGVRVLWERHGAALSRHCRLSESALAPTLDEIISWPLDVLAKITATERALAH